MSAETANKDTKQALEYLPISNYLESQHSLMLDISQL